MDAALQCSRSAADEHLSRLREWKALFSRGKMLPVRTWVFRYLSSARLVCAVHDVRGVRNTMHFAPLTRLPDSRAEIAGPTNSERRLVIRPRHTGYGCRADRAGNPIVTGKTETNIVTSEIGFMTSVHGGSLPVFLFRLRVRPLTSLLPRSILCAPECRLASPLCP